MSRESFRSSGFNPQLLSSGMAPGFMPKDAATIETLPFSHDTVPFGYAKARASVPLTGRVLHVADRVTPQIAGFLAPAIEALAEAGIDQAMLAVDDLRCRSMVARMHPAVELAFVPDTRNAVQRWNASRKLFRALLAGGPVRSIHLHGFAPALYAPLVIRAMKVDVPAFYSPHTARVVPPMVRSRRRRVAGLIEHFGHMDQPVDEIFLSGQRFESMRPVVIASSTRADGRHLRDLAQLAVLLFDEHPSPAFSLIGEVSATALKRLKAAKVEVAAIDNVFDRATKLQTSWIYVAIGDERGFPQALAEAMASGLPCVALDTPEHRRLIAHGHTGLLCSNLEDMLAATARLLHSDDLRARLGDAARDEARFRFTPQVFRHSLISAYELDTPPRSLAP